MWRHDEHGEYLMIPCDDGKAFAIDVGDRAVVNIRS